MNHYEVLGVPPSASSGDVRKAYLELARRYHPDRAVGSGADDVPVTAADDDRMREINAAWTTLRDADRRFAYDQQLARRNGASSSTGSGDGRSSRQGPGHQAPRRTRPENATSPGWQPIDGEELDDIDLLDDTPVEGTDLPRWLQVGPAFLLLGGLVSLVVGLVASIPPLLAIGLAALVLSAVSFLAVPFFAVFTSRSHDPNP